MNIFNISSFHPRSILSWWYTGRINWYTLSFIDTIGTALECNVLKKSYTMNKLMSLFCIYTVVQFSACDTALDPSTERCERGEEKQYCEDDVTVIECKPCRNEYSSYSCWKQTGCYGDYRCRYIYIDENQQTTSAACLLPDSEQYQYSFAQDPLP